MYLSLTFIVIYEGKYPFCPISAFLFHRLSFFICIWFFPLLFYCQAQTDMLMSSLNQNDLTFPSLLPSPSYLFSITILKKVVYPALIFLLPVYYALFNLVVLSWKYVIRITCEAKKQKLPTYALFKTFWIRVFPNFSDKYLLKCF